MKKFSRMPKSEGGGGGGAAGGGAGGAGAGSSSVGVRVFAVGRYQVTLEESLAEGTGARGGSGRQVREGWGVAVASPVLSRFFPRLRGSLSCFLGQAGGGSRLSRLFSPPAALTRAQFFQHEFVIFTPS